MLKVYNKVYLMQYSHKLHIYVCAYQKELKVLFMLL